MSGFNRTRFARPRTAVTTFGYAGSGGSDLAVTDTAHYCVPVTPTMDSIIVAVGARLKQSVANAVSMSWAIWTDDATGPDLVVGSISGKIDSLLMITSTPTYRWIWTPAPPVPLTAGTKYWVGFRGEDSAGMSLEYEASTGSNYTVTSGGSWALDQGATSFSRSSSTNNYLIQGRLLPI